MGFFDWIRGKGWNREHEDEFTLPDNASNRQIRQAIYMLLDDERADDAFQALHQVKHRARPLLEAAVLDPRIRESTRWPMYCAATAFEMVLEILDSMGSPIPLQEAEKLVDDSEEKRRHIAALFIGRHAQPRHTQFLLRLFRDSEHIVKDTAIHEFLSTAKVRPIEQEIADAVYPLMKSWALRRDHGSAAEAAKIMLLLDRDKAVADLLDETALDVNLNWLARNIDALTEAGVSIPADQLGSLLANTQRRLDEETDRTNVFHWSGIIRSCLSALAKSPEGLPSSLVEQMLEHEDEDVRDCVIRIRSEQLGLNPVDVVLESLRAHGVDAMTPVQRSYYCVWILDAEVRNGGFLQYFSNSYGENVEVVRAALHAMGSTSAEQIVSDAIAVFGAGGVPRDRDERNDVLARLIPTDKSPFDAHDGRWYADEDRLSLKLWQFAVAHQDDFVQRST